VAQTILVDLGGIISVIPPWVVHPAKQGRFAPWSVNMPRMRYGFCYFFECSVCFFPIIGQQDFLVTLILLLPLSTPNFTKGNGLWPPAGLFFG
jgi:hypothetical protein